MNKDIARSNNDSESIPCNERDGNWITYNENIFKALKKPADDNSFNNGGKKIDIQTPETGNIVTRFSLLSSSLTFSLSLNNISEPETYCISNLTDSEEKEI